MPALHSQGSEEVRLRPPTAHHTVTPSPFSRYRLVMPTKSVQWSVEWSAVDDSRLLVGVYEHGIGNWDAIKGDSKLGLGAKVTASGGARAVSPPSITSLSACSLTNHLHRFCCRTARASPKPATCRHVWSTSCGCCRRSLL